MLALALLFCLAVCEANLAVVRRNNPTNRPSNAKSTVFGYTIWSIDNFWYLPQAKNLERGLGFTLDPADPRMSVRRSPVYPLFFALHYWLLGESEAFRIIRWSQALLIAVSAVLLGSAARGLGLSRAAARLAALGYAMSPFTAIYAYYTITEALYPALTVLALYASARALQQGHWTRWAFAGAAVAVAAECRPFCGLLLPAVALLAVMQNAIHPRRTRVAASSLAWLTLGFGSVVLPWAARNYATVGDFIPFERYYDNRPMSFGSAHVDFRRWWSGWENPQADDLAKEWIDAGSRGDRSALRSSIRAFAESAPSTAVPGMTRADLEGLLQDHADCLLEQAQGHPATAGQPPDCDATVAAAFRQITARSAAAHPIQFWLVAPGRTLFSLIMQSFSSAFGSLNPRTREFTFLQFWAKAAMYGLNVALWLATLGVLVLPAPMRLRVVIVAFAFGTLAYLLWVLRYVEGRYVLQCYPVFYLAAAHTAVGAWKRMRLSVAEGNRRIRFGIRRIGATLHHRHAGAAVRR